MGDVLNFWSWLRGEVDKHFPDMCLLLLIFALLFVIMSYAAFKRMMGLEPTPENLSWARDTISAIVGCLLGRLSKIDTKSGNGNGIKGV